MSQETRLSMNTAGTTAIRRSKCCIGPPFAKTARMLTLSVPSTGTGLFCVFDEYRRFRATSVAVARHFHAASHLDSRRQGFRGCARQRRIVADDQIAVHDFERG